MSPGEESVLKTVLKHDVVYSKKCRTIAEMVRLHIQERENILLERNHLEKTIRDT